VIRAPKFYFSDVGVVNHLARRGGVRPGSELFGKAFENWVFHELCAHNAYSEAFATLSYWRLASGIEVDFIVNDMEIAIEAKATRKVTSDHLKGLRNLRDDHTRVRQRILEPAEGVGDRYAVQHVGHRLARRCRRRRDADRGRR